MFAEVIIDELSVHAIIGCNPSERVNKQLLQLSLAIKYDISLASQTDDVSYALDYSELSKRIKTYIEHSEFKLLECLSNKVLDIVFEYSQVVSASLIVYKPNAIDYTKRVGLKLSRQKEVKSSSTQKELTW